MASKIVITIEELDNHEFQVVGENDEVRSAIFTTKPNEEVRKLLIELGIKGKRGRRKGQTQKQQAKVESQVDSVLFQENVEY